MNVQSSTRCRALLDIYESHHKGRNGTLSMRQLEHDWKQTGLRRSDLDQALKDSLQKRWLLLRKLYDGNSYEMTYLGECAMHFRAARGPLTLLRDWLTLQRARLRRRAPPADPGTVPHNRRAEDRRRER